MNIANLDKINHTVAALRDVRMAIDRLPSDEEVLAYIEKNPLDMRIAVVLPPADEVVEKFKAENSEMVKMSGMTDDDLVDNLKAHFSCEVSAEFRVTALAEMRASLARRVAEIEADLRALGVDPSGVDAGEEPDVVLGDFVANGTTH